MSVVNILVNYQYLYAETQEGSCNQKKDTYTDRTYMYTQLRKVSYMYCT